jgi:hypothetical protein
MTFFVGNLVEVAKEQRTGRRDSEGGRAYIQAILKDAVNDDNDNDRRTKRTRDCVSYVVKYDVGGITSPNVKRRRLRSVIMDTTARYWLGETATRPSLLSRHHTPATPPIQQPPTKSKTTTKTIFNTPTLIRLCHQNTRKGNTGLLAIKKMNSEKQKGWLKRKNLFVFLFYNTRNNKNKNKNHNSAGRTADAESRCHSGPGERRRPPRSSMSGLPTSRSSSWPCSARACTMHSRSSWEERPSTIVCCIRDRQQQKYWRKRRQ